MRNSLLKWLGLDKPPQQRVRHKVWRKQLVDNTMQLKLGADRARQRSDMEMLGGTEVVRAVDAPGAIFQRLRIWLGLGKMQGQGLRQLQEVAWWLRLQEKGMTMVTGTSGTRGTGW